LNLKLIANSGELTIGDEEEAAWAIRMIPTLRLRGKVAQGKIVNSEGARDGEVWGKRAAWVDYYGPDRAGNPVGIAILDHPENLRHPTWWHARDYGLLAANPFGEGKFEKKADRDAGRYVIPTGEALTFRYRTIFARGRPRDGGDCAGVRGLCVGVSGGSAPCLAGWRRSSFFPEASCPGEIADKFFHPEETGACPASGFRETLSSKNGVGQAPSQRL